jgi:hypothetical protein
MLLNKHISVCQPVSSISIFNTGNTNNFWDASFQCSRYKGRVDDEVVVNQVVLIFVAFIICHSCFLRDAFQVMLYSVECWDEKMGKDAVKCCVES